MKRKRFRSLAVMALLLIFTGCAFPVVHDGRYRGHDWDDYGGYMHHYDGGYYGHRMDHHGDYDRHWGDRDDGYGGHRWDRDED